MGLVKPTPFQCSRCTAPQPTGQLFSPVAKAQGGTVGVGLRGPCSPACTGGSLCGGLRHQTPRQSARRQKWRALAAVFVDEARVGELGSALVVHLGQLAKGEVHHRGQEVVGLGGQPGMVTTGLPSTSDTLDAPVGLGPVEACRPRRRRSRWQSPQRHRQRIPSPGQWPCGRRSCSSCRCPWWGWHLPRPARTCPCSPSWRLYVRPRPGGQRRPSGSRGSPVKSRRG